MALSPTNNNTSEYREKMVVPPQAGVAAPVAKPTTKRPGLLARLFAPRPKKAPNATVQPEPAPSTAVSDAKVPSHLSAPVTPKSAAVNTEKVTTPAQESAGGLPKHSKVEQTFQMEKLIVRYRDTGRRLLIVVVSIAIFLIVFAVGYYVIKALLPAKDSDRDGVPNVSDQCPDFDDHTDTDQDAIPDGCDPVVTPNTFNDLTLTPTQLFNNANGSVDVAFTIKNANAQFGFANLHLTLTLKNQSGATIEERVIETFVNPNAVQPFVVPGIKAKEKPASAEVRIASGDWNLPVTNEEVFIDQKEVQYEVKSQPGLYSRLSGAVTNDSNFDLDQVLIIATIKNSAGDTLSVNSTVLKTLTVGESRFFEIRWPEAFAGTMARYELSIITNIMDPDNLLKKQGGSVEF